MHRLAEIIEKRFTDEYEVFTPGGYKDFSGVCKTIPYQIYEINFTDGNSIKCADNHIFISNNQEIFAKDLTPGSKIDGKKDVSIVRDIVIYNEFENMYDLMDVEGAIYYTNDVVSHNTTVVSVHAIWYALFNGDKTIGIVSNKQVSAIDIMNRIKRTYEELPSWIKPGITEYSKTFITFDNGTKIMVSATSEDAFRGRTLNLMISDELAFVRKHVSDAFWAANYPTISASQDAKIILISTPAGMFNMFHLLYTHAERGENEFHPFKSTWRDVPGRDMQWAKNQQANLGKKKWLQEFECVEGSSLVKVFDKLKQEEKIMTIQELYEKL